MNHKSNKTKIKQYFYISFFLLFGTMIFYVSGISGILSFIFSICIYSLIAYFIYKTWKTLRKKNSLNFLEFGEYFLYKVSLGIFLSIVILGGFSYYKNEIHPTPMPTYFLSNGDKEVIFQAMSHIGSKNFYNTIKKNLEEKKKKGFVYYFEGVRPGTEENMKKFDRAIGVKFDKNLYENFSKLYGVIHQDNSLYFNLVNNKDYNIDLSIDQIMEFYEDLKNSSPYTKNHPQSLLPKEGGSKEIMDINSEIIKTLSSLNHRELSILRYINKSLLNFIIGSEKTQNIVLNNFANKNLFDVILDKRNEVLSKKIQESSDKKIFITYGLLHFKGVFEILKKSDKNWKITKTQYLYPIQ